MNLVILQLGDIHFDARTDASSGRPDSIAAALSSVAPEASACLVALTGDIAFSGTREEYAIAGTFLTDLTVAIGRTMPGVLVAVAAVPGNHDCDAAPAPTDFAEIVSNYFPVFHANPLGPPQPPASLLL
jgi:3',5'-cyclic AMP phosphodiesterase CpdA